MNESQEIDYAYHADRLLLLITRRDKLPAGSDSIPALDIEMISIEQLVRSYRLLRGHEPRKIARLFGKSQATIDERSREHGDQRRAGLNHF
jgi:hypothetical protein